MKLKTAVITIIILLLFPLIVIAQPFSIVDTEVVVVTGQVNLDIYSVITLEPSTVEIYQPSTVTVRVVTASGEGIAGRTIVIVAPGLIIIQPTAVTDSSGKVTATVYSNTPGTYVVSAKDVTFGYDITIQNTQTLYVVPVPAPVLSPEPYYTKGSTNTLMWSSSNGSYEYYIEVSDDPNFNRVLNSSGWIDNTSYQFGNLENEKMYFYRVKARNRYGGVSAWSAPVFSVQDNEAPEISTVSIGDIGESNTVVWSSDTEVEMLFSVRDNLQLENVQFICVNSKGQTYQCAQEYSMNGDLFVVTIRLGDLERISGTYLKESYEFCVEATDAVGNITRVCNIFLKIPQGRKEIEDVKEPTIIERLEKIVEDMRNDLDDSIGRLDPGNLQTVTTTTSIITVATAFLLTFGGLVNLPFVILQSILNLLTWFGFRVGKKPLGYVYDAITKDAIAQAIIRIYDVNGKMVWSDVTDDRGYFSAKLESGKYKIVVTAQGYTYPSTIVFGRDDYPLANVYHGEDFDYDENQELNFSIPLDPKEVSKFKVWREILWGRIRVLVHILHTILFVIGLILAIYMYYKNPYWLTLLVLVLYIPSFLFMIRRVFAKKSKYGVVYDINGNPVEGVVVGLREMEFEKLILKRVTDSKGRYRMLAQEGRYRLEVLDSTLKVEKIVGDSEILITKKEEWVVKGIVISKITEQ